MTRWIGQAASRACLLEAAAPKVGNVHRGADFADLTFYDFCEAALAIAPAMEDAAATGVGQAVLSAIQATRAVVDTNVNLGIALLLAPLAAVPADQPLDDERVGAVLDGLTADDARLVYRAIALSNPGGMGRVDEMDVAGEPPADLLAAMRAAAPRDMIAQQYVDRFQLVRGELADRVEHHISGRGLASGIVHAHVESLSRRPDSLIARKCGPAVAQEASLRSQRVLEAADEDAYFAALSDLDFWMRSDGQRRNPGATADLIAAALFVLIRQRRV